MHTDYVASSLGLRLYDLAQGSSVYRNYRFYISTLGWQRDEILKYQRMRLKYLLQHANENVHFYRKRFLMSHFDPNAEDFLDKFRNIPPLTRRDIQDNLDDLASWATKKRGSRRISSSGTTGIPIEYCKDRKALSIDTAATYVLWHMQGYKIGDRRLHIWGNPNSAARWRTLQSQLKSLLLNHKNYPSYLAGEPSQLTKLVEMVNEFRPDYIEGYTSCIYLLARYIQDNRVKIHRPKRVFTTAEDLYSYQREVIENSLAPVVDYYGCGEINGVAIQCTEKNYHILEPRVLVEEGGRVSSMRSILLTDLENYAMPLIRYEVGDMFDGLSNGEKCACGLNFQYFRKLHGRYTDLVTLPNGQVISPVTLFGGTTLRRFVNIIRHQTVWNGKYFIVICEVDKNISDEKALQIEHALTEELSDYAVSCRVKFTSEITCQRSKFCYFKVDYEAR